MEIKKVGVLGCGLMGSGIAQVSATAGLDVTVLEAEQKFLDKGFAGIEKSLAKLAEKPADKGGLKEAPAAIRARLKGTTRKEDLADCDLIIEAIIENLDEKRKMYAALEAIVKKDTIFASNTSSLSITELMTATKRPERFAGLRLSYGAVHAAGFCRPGYDLLHHPGHVRRIQGAALRLAAVAQAIGAGRLVWAQKRQGILRLRRPEQSGALFLTSRTARLRR